MHIIYKYTHICYIYFIHSSADGHLSFRLGLTILNSAAVNIRVHLPFKIGVQVIENSYQVMAILMMALAQAVDCLNIYDKLAPATKEQYDAIRAITPTIIEDTPFYEDIEAVIKYLKSNI